MASGAEEERRANRPYRRFVGAIFWAIIVVSSVWILRGIIRSLDRLPSPGTLARPEHVDTRALGACADDLLRLEAQIRAAGGQVLARAEPAAPEWATSEQSFELLRVQIVARCRLDDPRGDPAMEALRDGAEALERLITGYGLLVARQKSEVQPHAATARARITAAQSALKAR